MCSTVSSVNRVQSFIWYTNYFSWFFFKVMTDIIDYNIFMWPKSYVNLIIGICSSSELLCYWYFSYPSRATAITIGFGGIRLAQSSVFIFSLVYCCLSFGPKFHAKLHNMCPDVSRSFRIFLYSFYTFALHNEAILFMRFYRGSRSDTLNKCLCL